MAVGDDAFEAAFGSVNAARRSRLADGRSGGCRRRRPSLAAGRVHRRHANEPAGRPASPLRSEVTVSTPLVIDVARDPRAPAIARAIVRDRFASDLSPRELDDVALIVSELISNAVRHGAGAIELRMTVDDGVLHGEVIDEGPGFETELREQGADEIGGRGLPLVARLSREWGVFDGSSHVWFELDRPARSAATAPALGADERPPELD
jgi:anti-sigma regulatory factor (Ser/Thr protein kinase)